CTTPMATTRSASGGTCCASPLPEPCRIDGPRQHGGRNARGYRRAQRENILRRCLNDRNRGWVAIPRCGGERCLNSSQPSLSLAVGLSRVAPKQILVLAIAAERHPGCMLCRHQ